MAAPLLTRCTRELSSERRLWLDAALLADPELAPEVEALLRGLRPASRERFLDALAELLPGATSPAGAVLPALASLARGCSGPTPRDEGRDAG